jgi:predicted transcriptional regulator
VAKTNAGIRVESELLARLDVIATKLAERAEGTEVTRSDAARTALAIGVEALEQRLGIATPKEGTKPARKPKP